MKSTQMLVAKSLSEFNVMRKQLLGSGGNKLIGFVPTMGNLHDGHLELMKTAKRHSDIVVTSIFVNPAQFAAHEDFDKYPRTLENDLNKMKEIGVDLVLAPQNITEIYPKEYMTRVFMSKISTQTAAETHPLRNTQGGGTSLNQESKIFVNWLEDQPEAQCRPGFFDGVSTILVKLFNIVRPQVVVFGQKDAVQCMVVKQLVRDLNYVDIEKVIIGETCREKDGLAMSSRNQYLSSIDRTFIAPILNQTLRRAEEELSKLTNSVSPLTNQILQKWLEDSYEYLEQLFNKNLKEHYSGQDLSSMASSKYCIDYLSICDWENGHVYGTISTNKEYSVPNFKIESADQNRELCLSGTIRVGGTRLLDNLIIKRIAIQN
ncbi:hypothetical protein C9374_003811 [Naegleria lovaniensis]|uniref:Pantoate--beta-alanine ligase n=1 Tax=Naegleria lovaniensis TaxID=51637 RepID=A0AA88H8H2_NAELO|nr:uncharacterized protein C9374_003811 [Naegleria lovaniensis]KAG2394047.1 hypothetical protein C9374_003811 [Naegleria lovaniensis]